MDDRTPEVAASGFTDHVLVCTTDRDEHACCGDAGAEAVLTAVKQWLRERDVFWSNVHVAETSCLGLCSETGTGVVLQPRGRWYAGVTPEEVPDLLAEEFGPEVDRLGAGVAVE
ncbi:ferredoxin [Halosegnis sp.]|uniref:(2Fe-2S) ferredoxin domain-containing protein n=1 Tax=Halosegnis sp. TaxID=2864959 RepID=UPI0035D4A144